MTNLMNFNIPITVSISLIFKPYSKKKNLRNFGPQPKTKMWYNTLCTLTFCKKVGHLRPLQIEKKRIRKRQLWSNWKNYFGFQISFVKISSKNHCTASKIKQTLRVKLPQKLSKLHATCPEKLFWREKKFHRSFFGP